MLKKIITEFTDDSKEAHKIFFTTGVIGGFIGISLWIFAEKSYAYFWHPELMITNYLLPIACGFLLVSVPKFLGTSPSNAFDKIIPFVIFYALIILALFAKLEMYFILKIFLFLYLIFYGIIKIIKRKGMIPYFFPFVIFAFLLGLTGALAQAALHLKFISSDNIFYLGRKTYFQGFFWVLFAGVASKFMPMMMQVAPAPAKKNRFLPNINPFSKPFWVSIGFLLTLTYYLEAFQIIKPALVLRAFLVLIIAKKGWHLFEKRSQKTKLSTIIRVLFWHVLIGHFVMIFFVQEIIHIAHILFIGAFSMGTVIVMTRVSLGHEKIPFEMEQKSKLYFAALGILIIALWTRVSAIFLKSYFIHLEMASVTWAVAMLLWIVTLFRWFHKHKAEQEPA
ncbi:MAG: NnrS family protein [Spirochaetia bacterium]|nr:NnrS family protein [Spirochaetia bacterium]